jgi:hypothetical protein
MIDQGFYLADRSIAARAGVLESAYVTADGRFVLDSQALKFVRLTPDEFVTGLQGVEKISYEEAKSLIAAGGYRHIAGTAAEETPAEADGKDDGGDEENNENGKEE